MVMVTKTQKNTKKRFKTTKKRIAKHHFTPLYSYVHEMRFITVFRYSFDSLENTHFIGQPLSCIHTCRFISF